MGHKTDIKRQYSERFAVVKVFVLRYGLLLYDESKPDYLKFDYIYAL